MTAAPLVTISGIASDALVWDGAPPHKVLASDAFTIEAMAADILARAPDRFALAGHSMGGYIALAMMAAAPERIDRIALISSSAGVDTDEQRRTRMKSIALARNDFERLAGTIAASMSDRPSVGLLFRQMMIRAGADAFIRHQEAVMARPRGAAGLAQVNRRGIPFLIVSGLADNVVNPQFSLDMLDAVAHARYVGIAGCGHAPTWEAPAETFSAMEDWLTA